MGYYDEHVRQTRTTRSGNRRSTALSAFLGAVIGAVVVLFSVPILANLGWLPYEIHPNEETSLDVEENRINDTSDLQSVSYSVNTDITEIVENVSEAVVGVVNIQQAGFLGMSGEGTGSGVVYKITDEHAFIVTNQHVIEGANTIEVSLSDGTRVEAELIGEDVLTDLAVIRIDGSEVDTVAEFGDSNTLRVGEPAIAIGNPLGLEFASSVTQGIISGTERSIPVDTNGDGQVDWHAEVIQTDAAINPGNSGGALLNIEGQVIGINSMKIAQSAVEGIGFAIPTAIALPIIDDLERFSEVRRPQLGVGIISLNQIQSFHWQETLNLPTDVRGGVVVTSVSPSSPAAGANMQEYDVIVEIGGVEVNDTHDLRKFLYTEAEVGQEVEVVYYRDGQKETATLTLQEQESF
ncbi:serine protease [Alkalihalobacillus alcalophilus ATCC 27647 = CGMCC 1.3604]|uniref:Serine protease n=1 Tax=Alkalihalobacillus alcalophilus ATCC 27647 = CGMCC 1.3604 TaxID=1218173 RepID=A0A094WK67_ALKAL|nr:trypsin-like peptidase domain-containing protein [Alkalihalobacillus alcalophilus]KGA96338.1 serine protease [Alkalihalobacillus alcalophilus ATCC 27647 = CGMCC 1.3604]MED1560746.1 trypsin-like peptidase domain-containing protein [Alkalihalobacillus alcalophilus]THG90812.1 serine protease [Alkalihalobacillus alcalophilus ATCC 27647 = CGMCC 1.3604]